MALQIPANHLDVMRRIVRQYVDTTAHEPVIFGSRAAGTARTYSDVDLGFLGEQPLDKLTVV